MGVGGSKNKNDEQVPLIQKQINDESEKNYYFPCILKIDYDSDKIELKTETDKTHELYIKDFLGDYTHIYNCSCSNCSKNNLNKIYYCNKCKKYICQDCLFNQEHPQEHLDECFIFIKSINICSKHDKVENILCKDCEKNVCSKCFDTFHKWHEKFENSDINKAKDIIIKKNEQLIKFIELFDLMKNVYQKDKDRDLYKSNINFVATLIKNKKEINYFNNKKPDEEKIKEYIKNHNIESRNNNRKNYFCANLIPICNFVPNIIEINASSGKIFLKCNGNHAHDREKDIIDYFKIIDEKKDQNPISSSQNDNKNDNKNDNTENKEKKIESDKKILNLKIEEYINDIELNNLILNTQKQFPNNNYYAQNIINLAEYIEEEESNRFIGLTDIDKEKEEKEALNSLKDKYSIFLEEHYKKKELRLKLKGSKDESEYKWLRDDGFILISKIRFQDLIEINLSNNAIIDITSLKNMFLPHLEIINFSNNKIEDISPISNLFSKKLSIILLQNNSIKDLEPFLNSNFPSLKILKVINNNEAFNQNSFKDVVKKFEDIIIYKPKWNDFAKEYKCDMNDFNEENFKNLNKLDLSGRRCGDIIIKDLNALIASYPNKIKYLILDNNKLVDVSLLNKIPLYHLKNLDLSLNFICNIKFMKQLFDTCKNLEILYLHDNKINNISPFLNDKRELIFTKLNTLTLKNNLLDLTEKETIYVLKILLKKNLTLDYKEDELNLHD